MSQNKFDVTLPSIKYSINGIEYEFNLGEEILFTDTGHNMTDVKGVLEKEPRGHFWVFKYNGPYGETRIGVSKSLILNGTTTLKKIPQPVLTGGSKRITKRRTKRRTKKTKQSRSMKKFRRK